MDPEINPPLKISLFSKTPDLPASEKEVVGNVRSNHERAESFWWRPQTWPGLEQLTPTAVFKRLLNTPSNWSFQETSSSSWGPGRTVYLNSDLVWNSWHQKDPQAAAAVFNRVTHPAIQDTVTDAPWNTDTKQLTPQPQWHTLQYRLVFFDDNAKEDLRLGTKYCTKLVNLKRYGSSREEWKGFKSCWHGEQVTVHWAWYCNGSGLPVNWVSPVVELDELVELGELGNLVTVNWAW